MKRYNGPLKVGMEFLTRTGGKRHRIAAIAPGTPFPIWWNPEGAQADGEENFRTERVLVRPTTADGWRLFLPDTPLADTGAKTFLVGQVYAYSNPNTQRRAVFEIVRVGAASDLGYFKVLAGDDVGGAMCSDGAVCHAVLIFDAPSAVPSHAPHVGRRLAEGWTRVNGGAACQGQYSKCWPDGQAIARKTRSLYWKLGARYPTAACEACAEGMGVFADAAPVTAPATVAYVSTPSETFTLTYTDTPTSPAPACDHPRDDKCRVPGGCDVFKRLRESVMKKRGVVASGPTLAVGTYDDDGRFRGRDDSPRGMTFLANLAREKPPAVPAPRVRDIYLVELDSGWVPGSEVR